MKKILVLTIMMLFLLQITIVSADSPKEVNIIEYWIIKFKSWLAGLEFSSKASTEPVSYGGGTPLNGSQFSYDGEHYTIVNYDDFTSVYAEGWGEDIGDISIGSAGVYYNITNITIGQIRGLSLSNGLLTVDIAGTYKIDGSYSFSGGANTEYHIGVAKNGVVQKNCHAERVIGTGGDVGNAGVTCMLSLVEGDYLQAQIENVDNTNDATIHNINFNMVRIGV